MPNENDNLQKKPFKVTISDEDYLGTDSSESVTGEQHSAPVTHSRPKFEVHIEDNSDNLEDLDNENQYRGEIYFSNIKAVKTPAVTQTTASSQKKKKKRKSQGAFVLFLAVCIILTTTLSVIAISCINDVLAFGRDEETVTITIPLEANTNDIIDLLAQEGLIKQKIFCKLYYMLIDTMKNLNRTERKVPVYLSGVYYVPKNLGLEGYLYEFREIQTGKDTVMVSIPEGWSIYQIFDRLDKFGVCSKSKLLSSLTGTDFEYKFIKNVPNSSDRVFKLEGYLYPNTYEFYMDSDANSVLRKFFDEFETNWTDDYQKQADKLGYTQDEILIIASIIQREAADKEQMGDISSVIHNRLRNLASWPILGCDSTTTYIRKYVKPNVPAAQGVLFAQRYDTYAIQGLPPGPICNPGDDAINAALFPNETPYYFFRHDKYGKIYLAITQAEHDANANLVLRANNN